MSVNFRRIFGFGVVVVAVGATGLVLPNRSDAALNGITRVASGLSGPIYVTHAPGDRDRLFIAERAGTIRILNLATNTLEPTPFLSIPGVDTEGEGGFLGMAFHPDYQTNGKFYAYVTVDNGGIVFQNEASSYSSRIREYTVSANPNIANTSFTPIIEWLHPQNNHAAGWIGFNPQLTEGQPQYLYLPTGDGGGGGDRDNDGDDDGHTPVIGNAQDISDNLLGKLLRIDINGDDFPADPNRNYRIIDSNPYADVRDPDTREVLTVVPGDDEIWARGLRNPFRDSFDRKTGDLWLGDVGQGSREEIDRQPLDATPGENFGWRVHEGFVESSGLENYRNPVYDYDRNNDPFGGTVVTGGYVYRGPDPSLQGQYFFLDSRNSPAIGDDNYWMFDIDDPYGTVENIDDMLTPDEDSRGFPVSFGEDAIGNLYIAHLTGGSVYRIDTTELIDGDYDADGDVDGSDFLAWKAAYGNAGGLADGNVDGRVNAADYTVWRNNLGNSVLDIGSGSSNGQANAPEPASLLLFVQIAVLLTATPLYRQRRRRL